MKKNSKNKKETTAFFNLINKSMENKKLFVIGILANCISTIASVALTSSFSILIDSFVTSNNFDKNAFIVFILFLGQIIFGVISVYVLNYVGLKVVTKIRNDLFSVIMFAEMEFFDRNSKGEISSRIINDSSVLMNLITTSFSQCIGAVISIVCATYLLFKINVTLTLLILAVFLVFVLILLPLTSRLSRISKSIQKNTATLSSYIVQALSNIKLIKSTVQEEQVVQEGTFISNKIFHDSISQVKFMAVLSPIVNVVLLGSVLLIITVGGIFVVSNQITMGALSSFLMLLVLQVLAPVSTLVSFLTSLQSTKGSLERIIELFSLSVENLNTGDKIIDNKIKCISFENVQFQYPQTDKIVLDNVSFDVKENEYIALIGPSGSGKSTIYSLIENFYTIQSGNIYINEVDISNIALESLRGSIGYVTQDAFIVDGSVRENLLYGLRDNQELSDEELMEACRMADIDEFIYSLEAGLDTKMGEKGVNVSGGQRQRLAIARTLLLNSSLILLDEATSSLDSISERKIQKSIDELSENRIVIVIAHRLSTIVNAKKILFLDSGIVTGVGSHDELLASHEKYKTFYEQQFLKMEGIV